MTDLTTLVAAALAQSNAPQTNTPLDVLAKHMVAAMRQFETSLMERSSHPFYNPGHVNAPADAELHPLGEGP